MAVSFAFSFAPAKEIGESVLRANPERPIEPAQLTPRVFLLENDHLLA
jgi:hypothetical protein